MGTAAVSLISFFIVLGVMFTVMSDVLGIMPRGAESMRASWTEAERIVNSSALAVSANAASTPTETDVDVVIENRGRLKYAATSLPDWEVIVRYQDTGGVERLEYVPYSDTLVEGVWTVDQIYLDQPSLTTEIYEPDIFNPEEEMVITVRLSELLGTGTTNIVTVAPPEGGQSTVFFNG